MNNSNTIYMPIDLSQFSDLFDENPIADKEMKNSLLSSIPPIENPLSLMTALTPSSIPPFNQPIIKDTDSENDIKINNMIKEKVECNFFACSDKQTEFIKFFEEWKRIRENSELYYKFDKGK